MLYNQLEVFIAVFTSARHWPLFGAVCILYTPSPYFSKVYCNTLFTHVIQVIFHFGLPTKILHFSSLLCPAYLTLLD
jgi:hypothetical protein